MAQSFGEVASFLNGRKGVELRKEVGWVAEGASANRWDVLASRVAGNEAKYLAMSEKFWTLPVVETVASGLVASSRDG